MRLAVLAGALASASCDTGVHAVALGQLDANPACEAVRGHSDLATIQTDIFDAKCASSTACHQSSIEDSAYLSLAGGDSWAALVNADAKSLYGRPPSVMMGKGTRQWVRVVPGDPANSYLMVMIDPKANPKPGGPFDPNGYGTAADLDPNGGPMPQNQGGLLCKEMIDAVHDWILAGAPMQ
jgi:hypothetical protein